MRVAVIFTAILFALPAFAVAQNALNPLPLSSKSSVSPDTPVNKKIGFNVRIVPNNYPTIQKAIDVSAGGDIVLVAPGTYMENIRFKSKSIIVRSDVDLDWRTKDISPETTVIDGGQMGSVVKFFYNNRKTVLKGFTLTNGSGTSTLFGDAGGGIYATYSSPEISNNIIVNNNVTGGGGGIYCTGAAGARIKHNIIVSNSANQFAGGVYIAGQESAIVNNMIIGNSATNGGGMMCFSGSPKLVNNTVAGNTASGYGGGIVFQLCELATVVNTVLWNTAPTAPEMHITTFFLISKVEISYSDVQGGEADVHVGANCILTWGAGMIDLDPLFDNPVGGDYHLSGASPCIDMGDNSFPGLPAEDFEGDDRILDGNGDLTEVVDMGADEYVL